MSRILGLVVLLALLGGGIYYWKYRSSGVPSEDLGAVTQTLRDTATTGAVKAALELNRMLKPFHFDVSTESGVVLLRGQVPSDDLRVMAEEVAGAVPDVRKVVNQVRLAAAQAEETQAPARTLGEALDDRTVEAKVRLALSLHRELKDTDIEVKVWRREVTLLGEVASATQHRLAVRIAGSTADVSGVRDQLQVSDAPAAGDPQAAAQEALTGNPYLGPYRLKVGDEAGRLVLRGRVKTGAERELAGLLVRQAARRPIENAVVIEP